MSDNISALDPAEEEQMALAQGILTGALPNAVIATVFAFHGSRVKPDPSIVADAMEAEAAKLATGDRSAIEQQLLAQSQSLQAMFMKFSLHAAGLIGKHDPAAETYTRLALKAQSQARATLEALAKMRQPREQVVRHVHVYEGGQAVVAEQLHLNGPGAQNAKSAEQPYEQSARGAALPGPDPVGIPLPVPSDAERAVPHSRRKVARRSDR